jgi:hypothetical protein
MWVASVCDNLVSYCFPIRWHIKSSLLNSSLSDWLVMALCLWPFPTCSFLITGSSTELVQNLIPNLNIRFLLLSKLLSGFLYRVEANFFFKWWFAALSGQICWGLADWGWNGGSQGCLYSNPLRFQTFQVYNGDYMSGPLLVNLVAHSNQSVCGITSWWRIL